MLRRVALVRPEVSQEDSASIISSMCRLLVTPSSPILVTLMMGCYIPPKHPFLEEPHGVKSQKTAFFKICLVLSRRGVILTAKMEN
jgi:hypothetical protein